VWCDYVDFSAVPWQLLWSVNYTEWNFGTLWFYWWFVTVSSGNCQRPFVTALDMVIKLWKETVRCIMSVCYLSSHLHATTRLPLDGFLWNFMSCVFFKLCQEIQVSLKSDKHSRCQYTSLIILRMRNVSDKSCREINTHILCSVTPPNAVYEIMWPDILERDKLQMTIW